MAVDQGEQLHYVAARRQGLEWNVPSSSIRVSCDQPDALEVVILVTVRDAVAFALLI